MGKPAMRIESAKRQEIRIGEVSIFRLPNPAFSSVLSFKRGFKHHNTGLSPLVQEYLMSSQQHRPRPSKRSNVPVALATVAFGAVVFALPFYYTNAMKDKKNLWTYEGPLNPTDKIRGAYMNTGSKDIGPDPEFHRRRQDAQAAAAAASKPPPPGA
jgi:hypothetical protein